VYYVIIVPIAVIRRTAGGDSMRRTFDRDTLTYKIPRVKRPPSHVQRQY
jgi:hypothetical protein